MFGRKDSDVHEVEKERINISQIQHTIGHIDCPACEATRDAPLNYDPDSLLELAFWLPWVRNA